MNTKTTPKDFFLNLGIMVALYVSVISMITLLFGIIDALFPDVIRATYYVDPYSSGIKTAIASIIVFYPLYIILGWINNKETLKSPEKKELPIRRWSVYLTLFVTGLVMVIDLVVLLNNFLGGEIGTGFILKVLAVLIITGMVFSYYILNLRGITDKKSVFNTIWISDVIVVLIILGFGFYVLGSPITQKSLRLDNQRISDLQTIQWRVINFWQQKSVLPVSIDALKDPLADYGVIPVDPETKESYTYKVLSPTSFELCANFSLSARGIMSEPVGENWQHDAGTRCFARTIDPERYPPVSKNIR